VAIRATSARRVGVVALQIARSCRCPHHPAAATSGLPHAGTLPAAASIVTIAGPVRRRFCVAIRATSARRVGVVVSLRIAFPIT